MDLSKLDPNVAAMLIAAVGSLGTWLYHRARGDKKSSLGDLAMSFVDQALHQVIITAESRADDLRARVTDYVWRELSRAKVRRSKMIEMIVTGAVESGIAEALKVAREHDRLVNQAIATNAAAAAAMLPTINSLQATADAALAESRREITPRDGLVVIGRDEPMP